MNVSPCFDAGSRYCPCDLAGLGQCVACSLLRGESVCACGWSGLCIYAEFVRNKGKPMPRRRQTSAKVRSRSEITEGQKTLAFIIELEVPKEIGLWCEVPGSFVLVRPKGSPERFNVPLSVTQVAEHCVSLAVQIVGPKTTALDRVCHEGNEVTVVGPFWSGLQGLSHIQRHASGRVLIVAKGIAQACAAPVAKYVVSCGGYARALLGPGPLGRIFAEDLVRSAGASVEILPKSKDHNMSRIFAELTSGAYDVLVSEGADAQHRTIEGLLTSMENPPRFAWSSNLPMTCGEGICGACLSAGVRGCKASLPDDAGTRAQVASGRSHW